MCLLKFSKLFTLVYTFVNISTVHEIQALGQPWFWMCHFLKRVGFWWEQAVGSPCEFLLIV